MYEYLKSKPNMYGKSKLNMFEELKSKPNTYGKKQTECV